jgi:hypothetical protein
MSKQQPKFIELEYYLSFNKKKFHYVDDIKYTLKKLGLNASGKKVELTLRLDKFYKSLRSYQSNIDTIISIQRMYREKVKNKHLQIKGPGFLNRGLCVNDEDFLTFEDKREIDNDYFFSYRDSNSVVFFFDLRSIEKLLQLNKDNPYTMEPFPESVKSRVNSIINNLKNTGKFIDHEECKMTVQQIYNARVIKLFQTIDELDIVAGGADHTWFLELNLKRAKDFYRVIEDIWNYRAELTNSRKNELVPTRKILNINPKHVFALNDSSSKPRALHEYLIGEMEEMVTASSNIENRKTCALFILTAFTEIHHRAAEALPWLVQH